MMPQPNPYTIIIEKDCDECDSGTTDTGHRCGRCEGTGTYEVELCRWCFEPTSSNDHEECIAALKRIERHHYYDRAAWNLSPSGTLGPEH